MRKSALGFEMLNFELDRMRTFPVFRVVGEWRKLLRQLGEVGA